MDPESKQLLQDIYVLEKENNKILRSIKRSATLGRIMSLLYWLIIIGVSVGAFYYMQPYFDKVMNLYNSISGFQQKTQR